MHGLQSWSIYADYGIDGNSFSNRDDRAPSQEVGELTWGLSG